MSLHSDRQTADLIEREEDRLDALERKALEAEKWCSADEERELAEFGKQAK